jgi:hypothetical protein
MLAPVLVGENFGDRVAGLDSVEQGIAAAVVLLATMMLALMLRALAKPIASFYAGHPFPDLISTWSIRGQLRARARARLASRLAGRDDRLYPWDPKEVQPTAFGNVLAAAADYPRLVYAMEGFHWWPRLLPLLPVEYQELLHSLETPMRGMLNLSVVFSWLGLLGAITWGFVAGQWLNAIAFLMVGLVLAQLCYRAAVGQAAEFARHIWVAFDLYRYQILEQMPIEEPGDLEAERALWPRLARRLHDLDEALAPPATVDAVPAGTAFPESRPPASRSA